MKVKLIRDKLQPKGEGVSVVRVTGALHVAMLLGKVYEEVAEVGESHCTDPEEYADVLQALRDLAALNGLDWENIERAQGFKQQERGGFQAGRVLIVDRSA